MMQVMIGSISAFTLKCVRGIQVNKDKAEAWLAKNPILVTALNPLIGYAAAAELVKEALTQDSSIRELAIEKARAGELIHREEKRPISEQEIQALWADLRSLTEGGVIG
jgi:fumarate hydratase class II